MKCVIDWDQAPLFGRRETLLRTLRRLAEIRPGPACIVETGTLRNDGAGGCSGDGWSTIAWAWYSAQTGGKAYTVDVNAEALAVCRRMTDGYAAALDYVHANSLDFFHEWAGAGRGEIDLLYLDSLDYVDAAASEEHHLAEATAALPLLAATCLVLFDDTCPAGEPLADRISSFRGKGARAVPFLVERGFQVEWAEGGQVLLSRGAQ
jgi:predicted O-methyltransferase YrrM